MTAVLIVINTPGPGATDAGASAVPPPVPGVGPVLAPVPPPGAVTGAPGSQVPGGIDLKAGLDAVKGMTGDLNSLIKPITQNIDSKIKELFTDEDIKNFKDKDPNDIYDEYKDALKKNYLMG